MTHRTSTRRAIAVVILVALAIFPLARAAEGLLGDAAEQIEAVERP